MAALPHPLKFPLILCVNWSPICWIASHHPARCGGVVNLCIPYFSRGFALPTLEPLIDRELYPSDRSPVGQWDYWLFYREHFARACQDFEADIAATLALLYRTTAPRKSGEASSSAKIRANGGWFGDARRAPLLPRDESLLSQTHFDALVAAFRATGFRGANAWYLNDAANLAFAAEALCYGRLEMPALFLHAARDVVCDSTQSLLAEPMREDCNDLTEVIIDAGHEIMLERPQAVNAAIADWLVTHRKQ